jgi:hypothetical protein
MGTKFMGINTHRVIKNFSQGHPIHSAIVKAIREGNMVIVGMDWGGPKDGIVLTEIKEGNMNNGPEDLVPNDRGIEVAREAMRTVPGRETKYGRTVKIDQVENGFIIQVGCVMFVETCRKRMFAALCEYWSDPEKAAEKYFYSKQKK